MRERLLTKKVLSSKKKNERNKCPESPTKKDRRGGGKASNDKKTCDESPSTKGSDGFTTRASQSRNKETAMKGGKDDQKG